MAKSIVTPEARAMFVSIWNPQIDKKSGVAKYKLLMAFPKGQADVSELVALADEALATRWPDPAARPFVKAVLDADLDPTGLRGNGPTMAQKYPELAGYYYINPSSLNPVGVTGPDGHTLMDQKALYSGCWVRAMVSAWTYDVDGNKGVAFGLSALQVAPDRGRPSNPLGNTNPDPEGAFAPLSNNGAPAQAPAYGQPPVQQPAQAPAYGQPPVQQPAQAPAYGQPPVTPQTALDAPAQAPAYGQPGNAAPAPVNHGQVYG